MDCIYGFQSIDRVKVKQRKRKVVSSGNSMPFISTGTKRGSLCRLKESSFVLVGLNVSSHLSPHSTILAQPIKISNKKENKIRPSIHCMYSLARTGESSEERILRTMAGILLGPVALDAFLKKMTTLIKLIIGQ